MGHGDASGLRAMAHAPEASMFMISRSVRESSFQYADMQGPGFGEILTLPSRDDARRNYERSLARRLHDSLRRSPGWPT
jgi:hypothetical protein